MAKINVPKAFDKQSVSSDFLKDAEPLIDFINQNFDQVLRALGSQLSFADNFRGRQVDVSAYHNQPVNMQVTGLLGAVVIKSDAAIKSSVFTSNQSGQQSFTFKFDTDIPIKTRSVTVSASHSTYEVQSSLAVQAGDAVTISGYGKKANNGTFMVLSRTDAAIVVYNASGAAETKTDFTGGSESAKSVTIFLLT